MGNIKTSGIIRVYCFKIPIPILRRIPDTVEPSNLLFNYLLLFYTTQNSFFLFSFLRE